MIFYDLIHGYQPFKSESVPGWVKRNLKEIFLPTSLAMRRGLVPRGIQLQGWTIESWLTGPKRIRNLAKKTLANLREAYRKGDYIEIGTSAYSHPILPMLSDDLVRAQIILDREMVEKYLGKPTWFWPPEGAIDKRTLKIVHEVFPDLILLIPDKALKRYNFNGPIKVKFQDGFQRAIVFNCLLKDLFMNAEDYRRRPRYVRRPGRLPKELVWAQVRRTVHSPKVFLELLDFLKNHRGRTSTNSFVLMRDWENAGSKKGLRICQVGPDKVKEVGIFLKLKEQIDFCLPSQLDWKKAKTISISKILPCSWDMESTPKDPFPWWQPNKQGKIWRQRKPFRRKRIIEWQEIIKEFDRIFQEKIKAMGGLKKALKNKEFKNLLKKTLPALHSCVAWHLFAKRDWHPDYHYSLKALEKVVLPSLEKIKKFSTCGVDKFNF